MERNVANPEDTSANPTSTASKPTTRKQIVEDVPETEDDILERMVVLSKPAEAKKAAI
jgi:hypothetical protein